ncbi:30S ribosomal protein S7 [Pontiella sp.]|uniref:30S ribosomal protein S7 n=1 Tax=Pontiella sp. TaxID=2837462 RepID=UPI0035630EB5
MARRHRAEKRDLIPDPRYNNQMVAYMINCVMERGKKSVAARIVYGALEDIQAQLKDEDPVEVFTTAIENVSPRLEVKSRRVGGATYQVPLEVKPKRQIALATRWLIAYASNRKGVPMRKALANEVIDAYKGQGAAIKKRDDTHKMAQANKAFAHYRW